MSNTNRIRNVYISSQQTLMTPRDLHRDLPLTEDIEKVILDGRNAIKNILDKKDKRIFVVLGPCSIHDVESALEYAKKLKELTKKIDKTILPIMRVYFEKPRTTVGWKGLINDPYLDGSFDLTKGLYIARKLLIDISKMGVIIGTEALDPITPQFIGDLISWTAIGARTAESQTHRELASGLSTPVGFKNGTDGSLSTAINAMQSATQGHSFLGINMDGRIAITSSLGNPYSHVVLRGGANGPNYDRVNVSLCEEALRKANLSENIVIDCSHANSNKNPILQPLVLSDSIQQICEGNKSIVGLMLESHINAGNQILPENLNRLKYGVSITDGCIDFETTENALLDANEKLSKKYGI